MPYQDLVRDAGDDAFALMPGWFLLFPRERTKHRDFGAMIDSPEQLSALLDKAVSLRSASALS